MKPMFYWSLLLVLLSCCLEIRRASEIQFQTVDMSLPYLSSASVCNRTSTVAKNNEYYVGSDLRLHNGIFTQFKPFSLNGNKNVESRLEVVDRHGPCTQTNQNRPVNSPSFAKILANDQLRVKSIQARAKPDSIHKSKNPNKDKRAQIPAQSGYLLNIGNYIVTVGLGTPKRSLSLIFDTGSYQTWTQCQPCIKHCYKQNDTIFDPSTSSTYSNISCNSKDCPLKSSDFDCYHNVTCLYGAYYGDKSYSVGFLGKDKLTVTQTDVFQGFIFGCGQNNVGLFGLTDGLLALGRGPLSFVKQTADTFGQYFSYCFPRTKNSIGFLAFGKNNKATKKDNDATMIFTPFVRDPYFYVIEITTISVGGTRLMINGSVFMKMGIIIDSGTVITRLPLDAYKTMRKEFKNMMKKLNHTRAPAFSILDTCYHVNRHAIFKVPTVSFTFKGNATINLDASGTLYPINSTYVCLAFVGYSDHEYMAVFGNTQQKKFEVAYDVAGGRLGFVRNSNCQ